MNFPSLQTAAESELRSAPSWRLHRPWQAVLLGLVLALSSAVAHADALSEINALLSAGDASKALRRADEALATNARNVQIRFLRGVVLMDLQRDDDAMAVFRQMSLDFPELPDPYNNIALLLVQVGQLDEARLALETALRNDPTHRMARANLGQVHLMLAARAWEQLAAMGPTDAQQKQRLNAIRLILQRDAAAMVKP